MRSALPHLCLLANSSSPRFLDCTPHKVCAIVLYSVSNLGRRKAMSREIYFRKILPPLGTILVVVLGEWGLWVRGTIIRNSLAWDSTVRFHTWPWPLKFAAVLNLPAILAGLLVSWPLDALKPDFPELISFLSVLLFAPLLWYRIGAWLDRRISGNAHGNARTRGWILLLAFGVSCAATSDQKSLPERAFHAAISRSASAVVRISRAEAISAVAEARISTR